MRNEAKVPFLFKRIHAPPESDLYEIAAGRLMNIISMLELNNSEIIINTGRHNINDYLESINSEVEAVISELYGKNAEPLEIFVLTSAIMGIIEAYVYVKTPLSLKLGISDQIVKLMRSYKTYSC